MTARFKVPAAHPHLAPRGEPPRLYVDRSDRDALGGFGLQSPRTRSETADQHLILEPALTIVAYDDTGCSAFAAALAAVQVWYLDNLTIRTGPETP